MADRGATQVLERLLEDDYLHEQLGAGIERMNAAYRRARNLRGAEAVQDKKLYDHVRVATGSLAEAARRAVGKPEPPPPPKRRLRRASILVILVALGGLVRSMHRAQQSQAGRAG